MSHTVEVISFLRAVAESVNSLELTTLNERYSYLLKNSDRSNTQEEFVTRHASLARFTQPASEEELLRLQSICPIPVPLELLEFYREVGGFRGGDRLQSATLHSPIELLRAVTQPSGPWELLRSMGLANMVQWSWGNDRFEFDPESVGGLTQAHVDILNSNYAIFGWREMEDGEAYEYLYFDRVGQFGRLFYHQDNFDELWRNDLRPMIRDARSAPSNFASALGEFVRAAQEPPFPD